MHFRKEQLQHIARLARLGLDASELDALQQDLTTILGYAQKLDDLDVTDVLPTTHTAQLTHILREDVVDQTLLPEEILANAPDTVEGRFRVPKVVADPKESA